ncbi:hypothetical protein T03_5621 [Trichinella britovi]|uniref:Uncharacterized protein n=1 Tax=Trichinella britovi TaxID=45882 RepID=A0A0V1C527_TRIBR|nr:hypothetical protein T03_5621 [Trichinella britovi]
MDGTKSFNLSTNDKPKLTSKNAMSTALEPGGLYLSAGFGGLW